MKKLTEKDIGKTFYTNRNADESLKLEIVSGNKVYFTPDHVSANLYFESGKYPGLIGFINDKIFTEKTPK